MAGVVAAIRRHRDDLTLPEAAAIGAVDLVAQRIREGVPVDDRSPDGFTAVQLAAHFDQVPAAALLVRAGADLSARAQGALTVQALHAAAAGPTAACIPLLVAAGAPLDDPQDRGFRPLHELALRGLTEMVELLLAAGADPSIEDDDGRDAATHADGAGHGELAARLRSAASRS
jgi:ankyrin repeat protein